MEEAIKINDRLRRLTTILWCVDVDTEDRDHIKAMATHLKAFTLGCEVDIEPVYVVDNSQWDSSPQVYGDHHEVSRKRFKRLLKGLSLPGLRDTPTILETKPNVPPSIRSVVEAVNDYVESRTPDVVALSTAARKGLSRFLLGSFTETLMLHSPAPLFITNPKTVAMKNFKRVLFSTDLSAESRYAFHLVISQLKVLKSKLFLFHHFAPPMPPLALSEGISMSPEFVEEGRKRELSLLNEWAQWAISQGVSTEVVGETKLGRTADLICNFIKKEKMNLVALASRSGASASVLLGSTTRHVIRSSEAPIWVLHPHLGKSS